MSESEGGEERSGADEKGARREAERTRRGGGEERSGADEKGTRREAERDESGHAPSAHRVPRGT
jgi:hypothetical protein